MEDCVDSKLGEERKRTPRPTVSKVFNSPSILCLYPSLRVKPPKPPLLKSLLLKLPPLKLLLLLKKPSSPTFTRFKLKNLLPHCPSLLKPLPRTPTLPSLELLDTTSPKLRQTSREEL